MDPPGPELDEHQDGERPEPGRLDGEAVAGDDPARLSSEELGPAQSGAPRGRTCVTRLRSAREPQRRAAPLSDYRRSPGHIPVVRTPRGWPASPPAPSRAPHRTLHRRAGIEVTRVVGLARCDGSSGSHRVFRRRRRGSSARSGRTTCRRSERVPPRRAGARTRDPSGLARAADGPGRCDPRPHDTSRARHALGRLVTSPPGPRW